MRLSFFTAVVAVFSLGACRGCIEQFDPRGDWKRFEQERVTANKAPLELTEDGKLPSPVVADAEDEGNPIDQKYANFCAGCHGATGKGDGPAGSALTPKPRDFVNWDLSKVTDEHIAKVIRDGGPAVGLSASMAPWGSVLGEEGVAQMVEKVKSFSAK